VAAKPVDYDESALVRLSNHAVKVVREFIHTHPADRHRLAELHAELDHVVAEFRRLRPPPTFRKEPALRLVRFCSICQLEITQGGESFESPGAAYHVDCYERETGQARRRD
jgi:hypothetical protein